MVKGINSITAVILRIKKINNYTLIPAEWEK